MTRTPQDVAGAFHDRARSHCWNPMYRSLLVLHQPVVTDGRPGCQGCDQPLDASGDPACDPVWPCRTYLPVTAVVLTNAPLDNEEMVLALTAQTEQHTRTTHPNAPTSGVDHPQGEPV